MFILYPETLLTSLIDSRVILWISWDFQHRQTCHLQLGKVAFLPLWSVWLLFPCLDLLHWLQFPEQRWISMVRVTILVLFLILEYKHSVFHHLKDFFRKEDSGMGQGGWGVQKASSGIWAESWRMTDGGVSKSKACEKAIRVLESNWVTSLKDGPTHKTLKWGWLPLGGYIWYLPLEDTHVMSLSNLESFLL